MLTIGIINELQIAIVTLQPVYLVGI